MIAHILLALGLVLIVEGLAYALAPSLVEKMLEALKAAPKDTRRWIGISCLGLGLVVVYVAKILGA